MRLKIKHISQNPVTVLDKVLYGNSAGLVPAQPHPVPLPRDVGLGLAGEPDVVADRLAGLDLEVAHPRLLEHGLHVPRLGRHGGRGARGRGVVPEAGGAQIDGLHSELILIALRQP